MMAYKYAAKQNRNLRLSATGTSYLRIAIGPEYAVGNCRTGKVVAHPASAIGCRIRGECAVGDR